MAAQWNRAGHYIFCPVVSSSIFCLLFSSPNVNGRRLDVYHTFTHGVALVRIRMQVWNMLHAARWKCRTQKIAKNSPSAHHRTTLSGYVFATKARLDNRKKNLLNSNISSTSPHNMANFGPLTAEICWREYMNIDRMAPNCLLSTQINHFWQLHYLRNVN